MRVGNSHRSTVHKAGGVPGFPTSGSLDPCWAWAPFEPTPERPWDLRWAGHLYRRAGFGGTWDELRQAIEDGPQRTIDRLLQPVVDTTAFDRTYDDYESSATDSESTDTLRAWWLRRMIHTPHPLLEKMTLFWHSHFAISNRRVKSALLMQQHIRLLRRHALGRFGDLLAGVSQDPATLIALDSTANRKSRPNQNYVRQLMRTFALGPGHFSELDVQEAARAFTGWFVLRNKLRFIPREHDPGEKRILDRKGDFGSKDVIELILRQPATARLIVRKLYRWLISETDEPSDKILAPLAESFSQDYDIAKLVSTMLRSNLFFSPVAYRRRIKNPVEFALNIIRALETSVSTTRLAQDLAHLGQDLYNPPTINGWQWGLSWINHATALGRVNLAGALLAGSGRYGEKINPLFVARKHGYGSLDAARNFFFDLLLQGDLDARVRQELLGNSEQSQAGSSRSLRLSVHLLVTLPEFQLA